MTKQLLAPLDPDQGALTLLFQANIDDTMLREIAEADYGWATHDCVPLLQQILETGLADSNDANLREVLDLIRWSEPADPEWGPGGHGHRGHWMRLFACTALLKLAPKYPESFDGECDTLAQLISSAIELGPTVERAAARTLAWRFLTYPGNAADSAFLSFAILLLAAHLERGKDSGQWLLELAAWVEDEESRARNTTSNWRSSSPGWANCSSA